MYAYSILYDLSETSDFEAHLRLKEGSYILTHHLFLLLNTKEYTSKNASCWDPLTLIVFFLLS